MPRLLLVVADFYPDIARALTESAERALAQAGAAWEKVTVPGCLEIPVAIRYGIGKYDGFVALGCVIRGETSHYEIVCQESARGLTLLAVEEGAAIGNGILTVENEAQALARLEKGADAARAALALMALKQRFCP